MRDLRQERMFRDGAVLPAVLGGQEGAEMESLVKHLIWLLSMFTEAERVEAMKRLVNHYCPFCGRECPCKCDE